MASPAPTGPPASPPPPAPQGPISVVVGAEMLPPRVAAQLGAELLKYLLYNRGQLPW